MPLYVRAYYILNADSARGCADCNREIYSRKNIGIQSEEGFSLVQVSRVPSYIIVYILLYLTHTRAFVRHKSTGFCLFAPIASDV